MQRDSQVRVDRAVLTVGAALACLLSACSRADPRQPNTAGSQLVFQNVTVIPMTGPDTVIANRTVFVRDGVIVAILPDDEVDTVGDAVTISGEGRFLIPGLADMHVHVSGENELRLYVANGITTVRNMWGSHQTLAMRARSDSGRILAPRIVTAGQVFDGESPVRGWSATVTNPQEARALIDAEKAAGFDFIKTYEMLSLETFDAIAAHATEVGMPFAGHVPQAVPIEHALQSGMTSVEHMSGWRSNSRPRVSPAEGEGFLRRIRAGEADWDEMVDPELRRAIARAAAEAGVWHVPTLIYDERIYTSRRQAAGRLAQPEMRYINPRVRIGWDPSQNPRMEHMTDDRLETIQTLFEDAKRKVGQLAQAGGRILAGTDAPNPFTPHGFALHDELQLLVASGLTPFEAVSAATHDPAVFLADSSSGTIEVGKSANMVLLRTDPLKDIGATRQIEGVVLRGRWLPRIELDSILEGVARSYDPPRDWFEGLSPFDSIDSADVQVFRTTDRGYEIGAERIVTLQDNAVRRTIVSYRSMLAVSGDHVVETVRGEADEEGGLVDLNYSQSTPSGMAEANAHLSGQQLRLSGRTVDGQLFERSIAVDDGELVSCELTACLAPIVARLDGLGIGEARRIRVRTLTAAVRVRGEPSGDPRFVAETWDLSRSKDEGGTNVYEATITRGAYGWSLMILVDPTGLFTVRVFDGPQQYQIERVSG